MSVCDIGQKLQLNKNIVRVEKFRWNTALIQLIFLFSYKL